MKALLEFNLPEEDAEFLDAQKGSEYKMVLSEFSTKLRSMLKYQELEPKVHETVEFLRTELYQLLEDRDLTL